MSFNLSQAATRDIARWADRVPVTAVTLPPFVFGARSRAQAWTLAVAVHTLLVAVAVWGLGPAAPAPRPPMARLVFVEPPPRGVPDGGAMQGPPAPAPAVPEAAPMPVAAPAPPPRPLPAVKRAAPAKPAPARRPAPQPVQAPMVPPAAAVAAAAPGGGAAADRAGGTGVAAPKGVPDGVPGGRGTGPMPAGQVAHPPYPLSRVTPEYPRAARQRGVEGLVLLEAILSAEGRITEDIRVLESVPGLDEAAIAALRRWRFKPARDERGQKVAVVLEVPIRFVLR